MSCDEDGSGCNFWRHLQLKESRKHVTWGDLVIFFGTPKMFPVWITDKIRWLVYGPIEFAGYFETDMSVFYRALHSLPMTLSNQYGSSGQHMEKWFGKVHMRAFLVPYHSLQFASHPMVDQKGIPKTDSKQVISAIGKKYLFFEFFIKQRLL